MRIQRAGRAEDQHRVALGPGIEDCHACMHQSDVGMQGDGHRPVGDLYISVGDRDAMFFVQADHHLLFFIAEIIHDAVVKPAKARARHQGDIIHADGPDGFGDGITAPAELRIADIVDTAVSAGQFKTLVAAVTAAGLVSILKGKGPFTVFASTAAVFAKLPAGTVESLLKPKNKSKLVAILTYHGLPGKVMAGDIAGKKRSVATV